MPDQARRLLLAGLRDAHAMEAQAEELMERQSERTEALPEVQARIRSHLEETRQQKLRLERCLDQLGDSPSTVKDTAMSLFGNMTAMMNAASDDELLKNALANNAFEHFEIASYKALLTLCEEAGAPPSVWHPAWHSRSRKRSRWQPGSTGTSVR